MITGAKVNDVIVNTKSGAVGIVTKIKPKGACIITAIGSIPFCDDGNCEIFILNASYDGKR
jgi:hypothetical protein